MTVDQELALMSAERDRKIRALGPRPRWWRFRARQRWDHAKALVIAESNYWTQLVLGLRGQRHVELGPTLVGHRRST